LLLSHSSTATASIRTAMTLGPTWVLPTAPSTTVTTSKCLTSVDSLNRRAMDIYDELLKRDNSDPQLHLYKAACLYAFTQYKESKQECEKCHEESPLKNRLLFQLAQKLGDENEIMNLHGKLTSSVEDQLCMAALHYLRSHFEEATEIYKKLLIENKDFHAINIYVALCYYKMDYYDVSLEILAVYLGLNPDSIVGVNLKACNHFQLYNGKAAEAELKSL